MKYWKILIFIICVLTSSYIIPNILYKYSDFIQNKYLIENYTYSSYLYIILLIVLSVNIFYTFYINRFNKDNFIKLLLAYNFLYLTIICLYIKFGLRISFSISVLNLNIQILLISFLAQLSIFLLLILVRKINYDKIDLSSFYFRIFIILLIVIYSSFSINQTHNFESILFLLYIILSRRSHLRIVS